MAQMATLRALAEPLLGEVGLELWDLEVGPTGVRFLVDRAAGVDLEALSSASRVLSGLLDAHEELAPPAGYSLEVSSPGLERTLRSPEHYRRFVGSLVSVKTSRQVAGGRRHRGLLAGVDDSGITLTPEDTPDEPLLILFEQIERARTVFVWESGTPKSGSRRPAPSAARPAGGADAPPVPGRERRPRPAGGRSPGAAPDLRAPGPRGSESSAADSRTPGSLPPAPPAPETATAGHRQKDPSR